jgi:hypothetical protein
MGRLVNSSVTSSNVSVHYDGTDTIYDADGYVTAYNANGIMYTNITYTTDVGTAGAQYGGSYKTVSGWTENNSRNISVSYNATGRVSILAVT